MFLRLHRVVENILFVLIFWFAVFKQNVRGEACQQETMLSSRTGCLHRNSPSLHWKLIVVVSYPATTATATKSHLRRYRRSRFHRSCLTLLSKPKCVSFVSSLIWQLQCTYTKYMILSFAITKDIRGCVELFVLVAVPFATSFVRSSVCFNSSCFCSCQNMTVPMSFGDDRFGLYQRHSYGI